MKGQISMSFGFDMAIIDTSALENYQFDFCGWTTKTLPTFFELLNELKIVILNHPVLDMEIRNHIDHSKLIERIDGLQQSFKRNKDFFRLIGISPEDLMKRLSEIDVRGTILQKYDALLSSATMLPFSDPEKIFDKYFNSCPPFAETGNKKVNSQTHLLLKA